jgi:hypothetical protein
MLIGDSVIYDGLTYVIVGFTPTSVRPAQIQLSDPATRTTFWVEVTLVREAKVPERAALRLIRPNRPS